MADRFWVGGTASWDATAGTKWATTSGGTGGASVPTAADDVYFDANSGAVTVTVNATANCLSMTCTGFTGTIAGAAGIQVVGNVTLVSGMGFTHSGGFAWNIANTSGVLVSAGKTVGAVIVGATSFAPTVTLGDALLASGLVQVVRGTFNTNDYNVTATQLSSNNGNTRTINLGSSTVTLSATSGTINFNNNGGLTFNAGTSTIVCSGAGSNITSGSTGNSGNGVTFYNVSYTSTTASTHAVLSINTFNNLTVTAPAAAGVTQVTFDSRQTINGTLSTTGTAGNRRVWFRGATYGIAQTLTINSAPSLTDADFRDIYVIGTAAPISGTRIGDLRGCRGITFDAPKTVYWNLAAGGNWSANAWAATSGGGVSTDNFPLAQDTAVIENTGLNTSATVTLDSAFFYFGTINMSGRTNAMTFGVGIGPEIYGNWTNGSGTNISGAGVALFRGRGTQTITSAGKAFSSGISIDSYGGTVELADALNIGSSTLTVTNGTFDTKNYNVTAGSFSSVNSNVRTINLGSSTITLNQAQGWTFTTSTNATLNSGTSQITSTATNPGFAGGGLTYYNVSMTSTSAGQSDITGANTFNNLTLTAPASTGLTQCTFAANQTINGTLTCAGATAVRRIFLRSSILGATRTLTVNSLSAQDCDFRDITIAGAAAGSSPTRAGNCGGNTGITFPAAKTVYWNLAGTQSWSATAWAPSSGGTPDINQFPLAQDTAVFDDTGSVTGAITINATWNIGSFNASARTSAMTLTYTASSTVYGDFALGTGVTTGTLNNAFTFSGRATQTITSNGVTFGCPITIDCATGTVQLADALTLISARTLTLTSGTFDAVTYNVTTGRFQGDANSILRMGSGTWTLSGTSSIWVVSASLVFFKGTANIVLSDTSTAARTFSGAGLSYNKLTIGGATGTSTLTIAGNNQFTELASTKTVAHTIDFGSTTQTFGAWTVTGTVGNVVTLTGTGTNHILAGACTSGIDYLAMGSIGFAATSPGEFYAGANSTATAAAAPLYLTAKPADSTRYWVGGTGNWSDTARWSTSSGGAGGASVPRSHDNVVFDSASNATAYTATVNAVTGGVRTKALTIAGPASGNVTLAGSTAIVGIHGDVTLPATGLTRTYTGAITLSGSATGRTLTTNGVTLASAVTVNGVNCGWSLGSALNIGGSDLTVTNGSFSTASYSLTCNAINSFSIHSRTIDLGASVVASSGSLSFNTTEGARATLTFNAGTSQVNFSNSSSTFSGNDQTFYNVAFTSASTGNVAINGANTFNNLSFTGITASAGLKNVSITANQAINGTLTLSAGTNATMRTFLQSDTIGTTRTLTCAAVSATDIDFRDITIAGAAAPVSGTRLGDCKGNSGVTFPAAKTVYYNLTSGTAWTSNVWSDVSGGTNSLIWFPLAQDTIIFPAATYPSSGQTVTLTTTFNLGTIDMSARTSNTMTLATSTQNPFIYGNWINGTGTTLTGTGTMTFAGRGSQTITSAGKTFTQAFSISTPGGSVTLQDALTTSSVAGPVLGVSLGTFDAATYNVTITSTSTGFNSSGTGVRTVAVGSGTWSIASSGTAWTTATSTNLTVTGTGTISLTSASAKTFAGGGANYSGITLNQGGAGTLTITGNNTFANISNTYKATGATTIAMGTTTQRVGNFTASGEAGRVMTVQGTSASSPATLIYTGAGQAAQPAIDYLTITGVRAYSLDTTWYAGANSTNNGSLGWYFEAGGGGPITVFIVESATANSTESSLGTFNPTISELASGSDAAVAGLVYLGTLSEAATITDAIDAILAFYVEVMEASTAADVVQAAVTLATIISESAQGQETLVAQSILNSLVPESAVVSDSVAAGLVYIKFIEEAAAAAETALAKFTATSSIIEQSNALSGPISVTTIRFDYEAVKDLYSRKRTVYVSRSSLPSDRVVIVPAMNRTVYIPRSTVSGERTASAE